MLSQGQEFLDEGRFEDALACFESGEGVRAVFGRGVALQLLGRFEEAESAYQQVLAAQPAHEETLSNLIAMNVEMFNLENVDQYAQRLLAIDRHSPVALRGLIVVAVERRDYESAATYFARLAPGDDVARDSVEYRLSSQVVDRLKDYHGSIAHPY